MLVPILLTKCNLVRSYELLTPKTNVKVLHYLSVRKIYSRVGYLQKKTYLKYYNTQIPEVNFLHNMGKFPKCQRRILQALHMFYKSFNCSREEQDLNLHLSLVYRIPVKLFPDNMERTTRLELATFSLEGWHSTNWVMFA